MSKGRLLQQAGKWVTKSSGIMVPAEEAGKKVVVIPGVSGVLGKALRNGIVGKDDSILVVGGTRRDLSEQQISDNEEFGGRYSLKKIDYSAEGVKRTLHSIAEQEDKIDSITWINTVGGGHPEKEKGETYEKLNVEPVKAAVEGLKQFREETGTHVGIIHLSSHTTAITPEGLDQGYTDSRHEAERVVKESGLQGEIMRLGIVVGSGTAREENGKQITVYNTNYEFSPENLANSSIAATLGSRDLPVQYVHSDDVAEASLNMVKKGFQGHMGVTNAVADDMPTQEELYAFHAQMIGKSGASAVIPLPIVSAMVEATDGGMGRLTPYALGMIASDVASKSMGNEKRFISPDRFTQILGREPKKLSDMFQGDESVEFPPSSLPKFLAKQMEALTDPAKFDQVLDSISQHGGVYQLLMSGMEAAKNVAASRYEAPDIPLGEESQRRKEIEEMRRKDLSFDENMPTRDEPIKKDIALGKLGKGEKPDSQHSERVYLARHSAAKKMEEVKKDANDTSQSRKGTAVVLGGKSQLGKAVVKKFMSEGYNVVVTTRGKKSPINEGARYHEVGGVDLEEKVTGDKQYWDEVFGDIQKEHGDIKCVINCAGEALAKNKDSLENINRRPVKPMLEAAVDLGVPQYTYISTKGAAVEESFRPGGYSQTKHEAEEDIQTTDSKDTNTTIIRPDLLVSANNPGHFGGPQIMSGSMVKFTAGATAETAGNTMLKPVSTHDVADAIYNIADKGIKTPDVVTASGPEEYSYSDLLNFFKEKVRDEKFIVGLQVPVDAVMPFAQAVPKGALEPNHMELLKVMDGQSPSEQNSYEEAKAEKEFKEILGRSRLTIEEEMASEHRPNLGDPNMGGYFAQVAGNVNSQNALPMMQALAIGATQSRIILNPNKDQDERTEHDGIKTGNLLLVMVGAAGAAALLKAMREKDKVEEKEDKQKETDKKQSKYSEKVVKRKDSFGEQASEEKDAKAELQRDI